MHSYLTVLTNSLVFSLGLLASTAASDELKGKVTAANGTTVEVETDSEYLPNVGDKVEIFIELKAIKSTALVTTGTVTELMGNTILVRVDNPKASVLVGQLARIDSPQPMKKGDAADRSKNVLFSDSFDRPDAESAGLGEADLALGGSGRHSYLPIWPSRAAAGQPIGASVVNHALVNNGRDFGGVQFTAVGAERGEDLGQDINIKVDLLVPIDEAGRVTQAGPYFRSRAAARGDGLIGGESAGYWVQLHSTGEVKVKSLNPAATVAYSEKPGTFDAAIFHTLEIAVQGERLQAALDGRLLAFHQDGARVTAVAIHATWEDRPTVGYNQGAAGIAFGAEDNRGLIGGQRADNLVVSQFHELLDEKGATR